MDYFWAINFPGQAFKMFGFGHFMVILFLILFITGFIIILNRKENMKLIRRWEIIFASITLGQEILLFVWNLQSGNFDIGYDIPLHLCSIAIIFSIILNYQKQKNQLLFEFVFFVGVTAGVQAILTPNLKQYNIPHVRFWTFFLSHSMLIYTAFHHLLLRKMRPTWKSVPRFLLLASAYTALIYGFNQLLRLFPPYQPGNYLFLSAPPPGGSLIDPLANLFGPSPNYIIGLILIGGLFSLLAYLPFAFIDHVRKRKESGEIGGR